MAGPLSIEFLLSKVGKIKPATRSKAVEIIEAAHAAGHNIRFVWGLGGGEHSSGLALDIMIYGEAGGDFVRDYVWKHRARLRLRHVLWEQHNTSTVRYPGKRRLMEDRGNSTENHYDHCHILFLDANAYVAPGKSKPITAKKIPGTTLPMLKVDGSMGDKTIFALSTIMKLRGHKVVPSTSVNTDLVMAIQTELRAAGKTDRNHHPIVVDGKGFGSNAENRYPSSGYTRTIQALQIGHGVARNRANGYFSKDKCSGVARIQSDCNNGIKDSPFYNH